MTRIGEESKVKVGYLLDPGAQRAVDKVRRPNNFSTLMAPIASATALVPSIVPISVLLVTSILVHQSPCEISKPNTTSALDFGVF